MLVACAGMSAAPACITTRSDEDTETPLHTSQPVDRRTCITTRSDEDTETSSRCSPPRRHSSCITTRSDEDTETQYLYESMYLTKLLASPPDPMRILKPWTAGMLQNPIQLASPPDPMRILKPNAVSRAVVAATTCITTRSDEDTETT